MYARKSSLQGGPSTTTIPALINKLTQVVLQNKPRQSDQNEFEKLLTVLKKIDADQNQYSTKIKQQIRQLLVDINSALPAGEGPGGILSRSTGKVMRAILATQKSSSKAADLKALVTTLESIAEEGTSSSRKSRPATLDEDPIRLEDRVIRALLGPDLSVISIWGKSGMGKSTLVKKVFHNDQIRQIFQGFVWVPAKKDFQPKPVLQAVLMQLLPSNRMGEIRGMDETELSQQVMKALKEKKSLVVLEDVRAVEDWKTIRDAFPTDKSSGTRVLITSSYRKVAETAAPNTRGVYKMTALSEAECLMILKEEADFDDYELETIGKTIYTLSEGCPLIVKILGKSLKTTDVNERDKLQKDLESILHSNEETQPLLLCYDRLSPELRACLLYMGQFPEGQDIDVEKLSLLLAAEDLIRHEDSIRSMLDRLAHLSLVEVQEHKVSITAGVYKSCRLHKKIQNFCISLALKENFFEIADVKAKKNIIRSFKAQNYVIRPSTSRLVLYLSKSEDGNIVNVSFSSSNTAKKIRSLLVFDTHASQDKSAWPSEINDRKEFAHIRVLDLNGVDFRVRKLPRKLGKLIFLRYLSFQGCWLETLPASISSLTMLETLDLRVTTQCKMTVPNNVLSNIIKLRHLFFPQLYKSDDKNNKLRLNGFEKLETLVNFDTDVCQVQDLLWLKNLKILAIISQGKKGDLNAIMKYLDEKAAINYNVQHSSINIRNFDCYSADAATTINMLLTCENLHSLRIDGQIEKLPENILISPSFTEMELSNSELEDVSLMEALGQAENLRSLVLSNDAFVGSKMSFSDASKFRKLRILKILNMQFMEEFAFEGGAILQELSTLVIDKCDQLKKVEMAKEVDDRLRKAERKKGDNVYSVEPPPTITHAR